ncbi:MAG: carbon-nitrogen hydrolase family protein [Chloroflexi bacterium]|nr:carbon-nitrogen hydrolase family protein [Chloroflexota bacterium]
MKDLVRVAAVQMDVAWLDPQANRERMLAHVRQIMEARPVDLIVFPELATTGYVRSFDAAFGRAFIEASETIPGPTTEALGAVARHYGLHIVVGLSQLHPVIPATLFDSLALIGPAGQVLGVQQKIHLAFEELHYFARGQALEVFSTALGNLGLSICYDTVFPELVRILSLRGAEIICACFNAPRRDPFVPGFLEHLAATRSNENRNFVVACNRVGVEDGLVHYGRSVITGPRAETLARSDGEAEEVVYADLTREMFLEGRAKNAFKDRRPELYGPLTELL